MANHWTGRKHSEESRLKMSISAKKRGYNQQTIDAKQVANSGEKHYLWKGSKVSYRNLHRWVERQLGKASICMINILHKSSRYHWANISKKYKRDLKDWIQMCPSCNCKDRIGRRVSP